MADVLILAKGNSKWVREVNRTISGYPYLVTLEVFYEIDEFEAAIEREGKVCLISHNFYDVAKIGRLAKNTTPRIYLIGEEEIVRVDRDGVNTRVTMQEMVSILILEDLKLASTLPADTNDSRSRQTTNRSTSSSFFPANRSDSTFEDAIDLRDGMVRTANDDIDEGPSGVAARDTKNSRTFEVATRFNDTNGLAIDGAEVDEGAVRMAKGDAPGGDHRSVEMIDIAERWRAVDSQPSPHEGTHHQLQDSEVTHQDRGDASRLRAILNDSTIDAYLSELKSSKFGRPHQVHSDFTVGEADVAESTTLPNNEKDAKEVSSNNSTANHFKNSKDPLFIEQIEETSSKEYFRNERSPWNSSDNQYRIESETMRIELATEGSAYHEEIPFTLDDRSGTDLSSAVGRSQAFDDHPRTSDPFAKSNRGYGAEAGPYRYQKMPTDFGDGREPSQFSGYISEPKTTSRESSRREGASMISRVTSFTIRPKERDRERPLGEHDHSPKGSFVDGDSKGKLGENSKQRSQYRLGSGNLGTQLKFKGEEPLGLAIGVMGVGGSGATTLAMALAQSFAGENRVTLVDLVVEGSQRMYHDIDVMQPGITEAIAGRRVMKVGEDYFERFKIPILERGYLLMLSISHQSQLEALRRSDIGEAIGRLKRTSDITIFDLDSNFTASDLRDSSDTSLSAPTEEALGEVDALILVVNEDFRSLHRGANLGRRLVEEGFKPSMIAIVNNDNHQSTPSPIRQIKKLPEMIGEFSTQLRRATVAGETNRDEFFEDTRRLVTPLYIELSYSKEVAKVHDEVRPFSTNFVKKLHPLIDFCIGSKSQNRDRDKNRGLTSDNLQRVTPRNRK